MSNEYYVYAYYYPTHHDPVYIGKGKGDRAYSHWKRGHGKNNDFDEWLRLLHDLKVVPEIKILESNSCRYDALKLESELIAHFGRRKFSKDGMLFNISPGFEFVNKDDRLDSDIDIKGKYSDRYSKEFIDYVVFCYDKDKKSLQQTADLVSTRFSMKVGHTMVKTILLEQETRIRTKSETRKGSLNPAYGRRGVVTKGFTGRKHTETSKEKISKNSKSKGFNGKHSNEAKEKISKAKSGKNHHGAKKSCLY